MNAHRVQVFDRADHHKVVLNVAHHFEFVFFPTDDRFLDQDLVHPAVIKPHTHNRPKFLEILADPASRSTERKTRPDDHGITYLACNSFGVFDRIRKITSGKIESYFLHRLFEFLAVLGFFDGFIFRADHFHAVFCKNSFFVGFHRKIQPCLSAHGRQHRLRPFLGNHLFKKLHGQRFDIRRVRELRVCHDGRRVGIDERHLITFFAQGFDRLSSGIIEFAGLTDNDRPGPDDQNFFDIRSFRHLNSVPQILREGVRHLFISKRCLTPFLVQYAISNIPFTVFRSCHKTG